MISGARFARLLAAALVVVGCAGAPPAPVHLDGRDFLSVGLTDGGVDRPLVPGTRVRLSFADGQLGANAGCNHLGAAYRVDAGRLLVGQLSTTAIGCDPPLHAQDAWVTQFLGSGPRLSVDGPSLVLESGTTRLALLDVEVAEPDQPLTGRVWVVESLVSGDAVSSMPPGVRASLTFGADGTVAVSGGCNQGAGSFTLQEGAVEFGSVAMTRMACPGPESDVEAAVLSVLSAGRVDYAIDGQALRLRVGDVGLDLRAETEPDRGAAQARVGG